MNAETLIEQFEKLSPSERRKVASYFAKLDDASTATHPMSSGPKRQAGLHRGAVEMAEDFDAPLPEEYWLGEA